MNSTSLYVLLALVVLAGMAALMLVTRRNRPREGLSPLGGLAFACTLAGLFFGEQRLFGYGLLSLGLLLAAIDIYRTFRR